MELSLMDQIKAHVQWTYVYLVPQHHYLHQNKATQHPLAINQSKEVMNIKDQHRTCDQIDSNITRDEVSKSPKQNHHFKYDHHFGHQIST